jgi:hypothetical protein
MQNSNNLNQNNPNNAYMNYTQGGPMPQITNNAPPASSQIYYPQQTLNMNQIPNQNPQNIKPNVIDQQIYNNQNPNLNKTMPQNQMNRMQTPIPNTQMPMNNNQIRSQVPIQNPQMRVPQQTNLYPNGVMPPQGQIIVNPYPVVPVMAMPYGYGAMMGVPGCIRCGGSGFKMNGMRCPCIGGRTDSEEFEDNLAMGLAFGMYPPYHRGFW